MVTNSMEAPRKLDGYRVLVSLQIGRGITHGNGVIPNTRSVFYCELSRRDLTFDT